MSFWRDLTQALRALRKNPGFTTVAVLTLALGIGANTAIFSIINGVLLSPLRYPEADRIVALATSSSPRLTVRTLLEICADGRIFEALSHYYGGEMGVQLPGVAEFTGVFFVNPDFFRVFGIRPLYGRVVDGAVVISQSFAERNFGHASRALGSKLKVENRSYEIAGVMPATLDFPARANVWVAASVTPRDVNRGYPVIARLNPGVPPTAVSTIANPDVSLVAIPLRDQLVGPVRGTLYLLMGAVGLVLLIACTNVANLMLARATARSREMGVRAALGARRWHIIRPLLVESAVLALIGGSLGLLLAQLGTRFVDRLPLPRVGEVRVDWLVLGFTSGISVLAIFLFGLTAAWQAARVDLHDVLKQGGSKGLLGGSSPRLRNLLVVAQIALSLVLAIGAGLLLRSFLTLTSVQLGYRTEGILVMYAHAPAGSLEEYVDVGRSFETLFGQLNGLPGVMSVAAAMGLPTGQYGSNGRYAVEGKNRLASGQSLPQAGFRLSSPGYFETMGIPLVSGREFSSRDQYDAPFVAIVSQALARQSFPNEDPIGRRLQCSLDAPSKWMTIVGVVGDVRQQSPASAPAPELYMPLKQHPYFANEVQVVMRANVPPESLIAAVRQRVRAMNPEIAMKFTSMDTTLADSIAKPRFRVFLISVFAALALVLAMAGVYGVMNYVVAQRRSEFGLRVALGASSGDVLFLVLGRALRLAGMGLTTGLALSLAASRLISSLLFGLKSTDAMTYAIVVVAVTPVILLAAAIPAWRATRVDALTALREE
jgi:putative ABC transport system permease protein